MPNCLKAYFSCAHLNLLNQLISSTLSHTKATWISLSVNSQSLSSPTWCKVRKKKMLVRLGVGLQKHGVIAAATDGSVSAVQGRVVWPSSKTTPTASPKQPPHRHSYNTRLNRSQSRFSQEFADEISRNQCKSP